jgi:SAM-dependent methyltransferase
MRTRQSGMPEEGLWTGFFAPEVILGKLGLSAACGELVDFGCGYGTFTIPAAKIVSGTVHALDLDPEMIATTQAKAEAARLDNLRTCLRDFVTEGTGLPDSSVDYAMLFTPRGPSMDIRPRPEQCRDWAEQVGFRPLEPGIVDLPPYHHGMVLARPLG